MRITDRDSAQSYLGHRPDLSAPVGEARIASNHARGPKKGFAAFFSALSRRQPLAVASRPLLPPSSDKASMRPKWWLNPTCIGKPAVLGDDGMLERELLAFARDAREVLEPEMTVADAISDSDPEALASVYRNEPTALVLSRDGSSPLIEALRQNNVPMAGLLLNKLVLQAKSSPPTMRDSFADLASRAAQERPEDGWVAACLNAELVCLSDTLADRVSDSPDPLQAARSALAEVYDDMGLGCEAGPRVANCLANWADDLAHLAQHPASAGDAQLARSLVGRDGLLRKTMPKPAA